MRILKNGRGWERSVRGCSVGKTNLPLLDLIIERGYEPKDVGSIKELENWENLFSLRASEKEYRTADTLVLAQWEPFYTPEHQDCKIIHVVLSHYICNNLLCSNRKIYNWKESIWPLSLENLFTLALFIPDILELCYWSFGTILAFLWPSFRYKFQY